MLRKILRRVLKGVGRVVRFATTLVTFLYVVPLVLLGYVYGITTTSFTLGRTLATVVASRMVSKVLE
jgi:hypothetical protein